MTKKGQDKVAVPNFPRRDRGEKYSGYRLVSAVGLMVIIVLLVIIGAQYYRQYQARQELIDYQLRIEEYEARQQMLDNEILRLQDLDYIEVLARNRLGLIKPGEIVFQVED